MLVADLVTDVRFDKKTATQFGSIAIYQLTILLSIARRFSSALYAILPCET